MSTIIVAAVGISISVSLLLLGLGASRTALATQQSYQAQALSSACAEEALQLIHDGSTTTPYTGMGSLTLSPGACSYSVINTGGITREIDASSTISTIVRKDKVQVDSVDPISISTWREVADF